MGIENADIQYSVKHKGKIYPVKFIDEFESEGYVDFPFRLDERGLDVNGVLVIIEQYSATKVLKVKHLSVQFEDAVLAGSGWFLAVNPEGKVVQTRLDSSNRSRDLIAYGAGWTFCWISDSDGLAVLDTTEPAFTSDMEEEVIRDSENDSLPQEFWTTYDRLLS